MRKIFGIILLFAIFLAGCGQDNPCSDHCDIRFLSSDVLISSEEGTNTVAAFHFQRDFNGTRSAEQPQLARTVSEVIPTVRASFSSVSDSLEADDGKNIFIGSFQEVFAWTESEDTNRWICDATQTMTQQCKEVMQNQKNKAIDIYNYNRTDADSFYAYSYNSDMKVMRLDQRVISLIRTDSIYEGKPYPLVSVHTVNFDLEDRKSLTLHDIIQPGSFPVLKGEIIRQLNEKIDYFKRFGIPSEKTTEISKMITTPGLITDWGLTDKGLAIFFEDNGDTFFHSTGIIKIEIPYEVLEPILLSDYFPPPKVSQGGVIQSVSEPADKKFTLKVSSDSYQNQVYVGVTLPIADVRIYTVDCQSDNGLPIPGRLLYSANQLQPEEVLEIPVTEENLKYLILYSSSEGERQAAVASAEEICSISPTFHFK